MSGYGTWPAPQCDKGSDLAPKAEFSLLFSTAVKICAQGRVPHFMCSPSIPEHLYGQNPLLFILE